MTLISQPSISRWSARFELISIKGVLIGEEEEEAEGSMIEGDIKQQDDFTLPVAVGYQGEYSTYEKKDSEGVKIHPWCVQMIRNKNPREKRGKRRVADDAK
jgi:hypothetical protein